MIEPEDFSWRKLAACKGSNPDIFFPQRGESTLPAKKICDSCPVKTDCLEWALAIGEQHGIWGGASERERRRIRRRMVPQCGTNGGYRRHIAMGETPCAPCLEARDAYWDGRKARNPTRGEAGDRKERNVQAHRDQGWCHACSRSDHTHCTTRCGIPCSCPKHQPEEAAS